MKRLVKGVTRPSLNLRQDQRGITGLETAIVLIAFVVVASVFAFAVLSTGLLSSEKSKETIIGGLEETAATLVIRGSILATRDTSTATQIQDVKFQVTNASKSGEAVNLSNSGLNSAIVTYIDSDQVLNITQWTPTWLTGSGDLVNPGESVEVLVNLSTLASTTPLNANKEFTIQLKPNVGATLLITRTTPAELTAVIDLN